MYAGRYQSLKYFKEFLKSSTLPLKKELKDGVVGGARNEHELNVLDELGLNYKAYILNISGDLDYYIDLNSEINSLPPVKFDLIICSQVLEHIWNIQNSIKILSELSSEDGYIFLNVPFSNMVHRDSISDFHSSGYGSNFLKLNFEYLGIKVIHSVNFGTQRLYNSIHYLQIWLFEHELKKPITYAVKRKQKFRRIRNVHRILTLLSWNNLWIENGQFSTESIIFAQKLNF